MSIYAIGDLHLSFDPAIEKPMDVFGPEWENHAERLRENWIRKIGDEDTVLLCGDISWGLRLAESMADLRWIDALPGQKIISKGNHDLWWKSIQKMNGLFPTIRFLQNTACLAENCAIAGTRGWISPGTEGFDDHDEKIYRRELLRLRMSLEEAVKLKAEAILCSLHYPPSNDKLQRSGFMDMLAEYGVSCCVYGHLHGEKAFRKGFQGSMDGVSYRLVSLDYIDAEPVKIWGA